MWSATDHCIGSVPLMLLIVDTDGVRTHDPLLAKQMFYQLNYWPIIKKFPVFQYADPVLDWIFCC